VARRPFHLNAPGGNKIPVIKVVREITGLGAKVAIKWFETPGRRAADGAAARLHLLIGHRQRTRGEVLSRLDART